MLKDKQTFLPNILTLVSEAPLFYAKMKVHPLYLLKWQGAVEVSVVTNMSNMTKEP